MENIEETVMLSREELISALSSYFRVGTADCDTYILMRDKSGFAVGTVSVEDFRELGDDNIADIADYIMKRKEIRMKSEIEKKPQYHISIIVREGMVTQCVTDAPADVDILVDVIDTDTDVADACEVIDRQLSAIEADLENGKVRNCW